jgi:hypothetical protein
MTILLIYMILSPAHRWEFLAIDRADSPAQCAMLKSEVAAVFSDKPGNIRVICLDGPEILT